MTNKTSDSLDRGNLGQIGDGLRALKFGTAMTALLSSWLLAVVPAVAAAGKPVTVDTIALPVGAKAQRVLEAYARSGTGTLGPLAVVASGTIPAAGQIAVSPDGDIVTAAADAWTRVDVLFVPLYADAVEDVVLDVVAHVATIPSAYTNKVLNVLRAEATVGTVLGQKYVDMPGAAAATGEAALSLGKNTIVFAAADVVTKAKVTLALFPAVNARDVLLAESQLL